MQIRRWLFRVALATLVLCGSCGTWVWLTWPDVERLKESDPDTTAFIQRYRDRQLRQGESDAVQWQWVPLQRVSPHLLRAVVAAEDMEFFSHRGFSRSEVRAAVADAIRERKQPRGASTITQQLTKNLWLSPSRNLLRKLKETILTRQLEKALAKERILEIYVNVVELGPGIYGVEAAARHYFAITAAELDAHESAMLAASLPRPSSWHPGVDSPYYLGYVDDIEDRVRRAPFLFTRFPGNR
ncbi:monofunctional biosynthetic peptidoglycan transglycosylase, partial [Gemmatimonadota bacterium]